jgi:hypothetical protein
MDNRLKIYVAILILIFVGIAFIEVNRPQEIDWRPHYTTSKKTPYGLYVLDKELKKLCNGIYIEKLNETPYEFFDKQYDYDSSIANYTIRGTYFSVEENSNLDEESASEILHFVSKGNEAFLAASSFSQTIFDSLKIKLDYSYDFNDTVQLKLDYVDTNTYYFNKINYLSFFDSFDTSKVTVLGHVQVSFGDSTKRHVNFIRVAYGDGFIFLHSLPNVFTNYHLLKSDNHLYTSGVLSFIQNSRPIYWNTNEYDRENKAETPLRVILEHASLRWAWYFILIGFLIYLLFNAKRKQRIIPIIPPVLNTTVDFTKTIANMYFQEGHFKTVMEKRIIYFLERVRSEFHLDTQKLDDKFIHKLQLKSGRPKDLIEKIVKKITNKKMNRYLSENDLVELNGLLEDFWTTKTYN